MIKTIKKMLGLEPVKLSQESEVIGSVCYWAGYPKRVPVNFMPCDGRSLSVKEYPALYSLLGTHWGGDGVNHFNIPDLRARDAKGSVNPADPWGGNCVPVICVMGVYPIMD